MSDEIQSDGKKLSQDESIAIHLDEIKRLNPAPWRNRPISDLAENLCNWLETHDRIKAMTNAELVRECLQTEAADWDIVNEMMTRLHPGWENEQ